MTTFGAARSVRGERPRVITTRDEPGELDRLLIAAGLEVVHVPLIHIVDAEPDAEGRTPLDRALARLHEFDWLVVTSHQGASRVGAAVAAVPTVKLACVGTRTARQLQELAGRPADVVPSRQTGAELVASMPPGHGASVLVAQADVAEPTVVEGLTALGYSVSAVTAYLTRSRQPTRLEREAMLDSDAVAFASGSAARAWVESVGLESPPCVIAIGPVTAATARQCGLQVTHVAADHSVEGLADEVIRAVGADS